MKGLRLKIVAAGTGKYTVLLYPPPFGQPCCRRSNGGGDDGACARRHRPSCVLSRTAGGPLWDCYTPGAPLAGL